MRERIDRERWESSALHMRYLLLAWWPRCRMHRKKLRCLRRWQVRLDDRARCVRQLRPGDFHYYAAGDLLRTLPGWQDW